MTESLPTVEEVDSIMTNIEGLIGVSVAGVTRSKREFSSFDQEDESQYERLWREIDSSLASLRAAGFYLKNPNGHQRLKWMRGFLAQSDGTIGERCQIPRKLYAEIASTLERLKEALGNAHAGIEVQRELRESARRTNELFIVVPCGSRCESFLTNIATPAATAVGLKPVIIERSEPEDAISEAILSGIRRSVLVLCDLTFERPNCYYEAGYAKGAFRRVILTCREDHDPRKNPTLSSKVHFDVDQFKITWWNLENPEVGRKELESRLRVLIEELGLRNNGSTTIEGVIDDAG